MLIYSRQSLKRIDLALYKPAGAPIIFIPKKDKTLYLYINYRALNKITIKNCYPLLLIGELINRLLGVKIFIKLDLKDIYY